MDQIDLTDFMTRGLTVLVATRDASLTPLCVSGTAVLIASPGRAVVFVPEYECAQAIENLQNNGAIAVVLEQPTTHRGIQLKGRSRAVREATDAENAYISEFLARAFAEYLAIGISPLVLGRVVLTPCRAVEFEYTDVFEQTPGPGAGKLLGVQP